MKLSPAQELPLDEIRSGITDDGPGIYIRTHGRYRRTLAVLYRLGLIEPHGLSWGGIQYWRPVPCAGDAS